jgi:hypothetical protein
MSTDTDREGEAVLRRDGILPANPKRHLTIIWEEEKQEIMRRVEALEVKVEDLERIIMGSKARVPENPLNLQAQAVRLPQQATQYIPSPMEKDYEGPTEGGRES